MSDTGETFRAMTAHRKRVREVWGRPCPVCVEKLPRANPTILIPQRRCRIHGYTDPRPELTSEQHQAIEDDRLKD
ncbi:hypothetical protein UFOVP1040_31 [uncultured Caudovirales phage]|uniref:Uncharacterized protein n=1 Tax=uncultured Caudovirales phage TaxID=2100421 RepID=A0A6J5Q748_9CAUD|nr:hypothetical protein UFOVP1040_31 [uncultured Caudovirales phage]